VLINLEPPSRELEFRSSCPGDPGTRPGDTDLFFDPKTDLAGEDLVESSSEVEWRSPVFPDCSLEAALNIVGDFALSLALILDGEIGLLSSEFLTQEGESSFTDLA